MQRVRYAGNKCPLIAAGAGLLLPMLAVNLGPRLLAAALASGNPPVGIAANPASGAAATPVPPELARSTDEALAEYHRAARSLEAGNEEEAVAFLESAGARPMAITELSGNGPAPGDISAPGLMIHVARRIKERVLVLSRAHGESEAAWQQQQAWVQRARRISSQILSTEVPTLDALNAARTIDTQIGRAEEQALRNAGKTEDAARVAAREKALSDFYRSQIMRELVAASEWRQQQEFGAIRGPEGRIGAPTAPDMDRIRREIRQRDSKLAESLMSLYARQRLAAFADAAAARGLARTEEAAGDSSSTAGNRQAAS